MKILTEYNLRGLALKNRLVMAPLTRCRAIDNIPNELMAEYYAQRANAGLIVTEGTSPSPNGLGYARIPGIYSEAQIEGWKKVTNAVHEKGGKIFLQIMHTGRASHPANLPEDAEIVAPSRVTLSGQMYTDSEGMQDYPPPREMNLIDILQAQSEYVEAAKNAITAGFDGVELHGANGYLIDQFINPASNQRSDNYGGSIENRNRFAIETAQKVANAIGGNRTGIRLSPYGVFNDMEIFKGIDDSFTYLARELGKLDLAYIHIVDHSSMGTPEVPMSIKSSIKAAFNGTIIISGGLNKDKAEAVIESGHGELVAFGRSYIANPDLAHRFENDVEIAAPDDSTFYTPGPEGYTDYPRAE